MSLLSKDNYKTESFCDSYKTLYTRFLPHKDELGVNLVSEESHVSVTAKLLLEV